MTRQLSFPLAFALTMFLGACSDDSGPTTTDQKFGTLIVRLTDSPAAYDSVKIVVDSVRAHIDISDTTGGWYTLNRIPAVYDLLRLVNGADTVIGRATLPAGRYAQMRLYIGDGSYVIVGGVKKVLETPSGSQSGVKLNIQATIQEGITYTLILDFDASRSIVVTGNNRYLLKPVIRATPMAQTGMIVGTVVPGSARPLVRGIAGTDTVSTLADTAGLFRLSYLTPATYTVSIFPTDTTRRDTTLPGVIVTAGSITSLGTVTLTRR